MKFKFHWECDINLGISVFFLNFCLFIVFFFFGGAFCFVLDKIFQCGSGGFRLGILLPWSPECWDNRHELPYQVSEADPCPLCSSVTLSPGPHDRRLPAVLGPYAGRPVTNSEEVLWVEGVSLEGIDGAVVA